MTFDLAFIAEGLGQVVDFTGILIIVAGVIYSTASFVSHVFSDLDSPKLIKTFRNNLGRSVLLGLELLIAGDIIRSVGGVPTLEQVIILGLIVVIRAFLGVTFETEVEGRWPWARGKTS